MSSIKESFDELVMAVIRPPRATYSEEELGDRDLVVTETVFERQDYETVNDRGLNVKYSLWKPVGGVWEKNRTCIVYLHPNSSSRLDVVNSYVIQLAAFCRCAVCGIDLSGSGMSEGEYISLGWFETEDVRCVVEDLLFLGIRRLVLFGRSMGAVTAAMFAGAYGHLLSGVLSGMVLDSPFTCFEELALRQVANGAIKVPQFASRQVLSLIRGEVKKKAHFDVLRVSPISVAHKIDVPCLVLSAQQDEIVDPALSRAFYDALDCPKALLQFDGSHNGKRPVDVQAALEVFLGAIWTVKRENFAAVLEQLEFYACVSTTSTFVNPLEEEAKQAQLLAAAQSRRWPWSPRNKNGPIAVRDDSQIGSAKDDTSRWLRWRGRNGDAEAETKPRRRSFFNSMSLPPDSEIAAIRSDTATEADVSSSGSGERSSMSAISEAKQAQEPWLRRTWNSLRVDRVAQEADRLRIENGSAGLQAALAVSRAFDEILDEILGEEFADQGLEYVPPPPLSTPQLARPPLLRPTTVVPAYTSAGPMSE